MDQHELIPHLFRTEYRRIISVLYRHFGFDEKETAEDIVSDTFLIASETWGLKGLPENPTAWLYNVARNKALNHLKRNAVFETSVVPAVKNEACETAIDLSPQNIEDSQLRMMFTLCHPSIPQEAQVGLSLQILCGFGVDEIADAFLTNRETVKKRLFRAREKLRETQIKIDLPDVHDLDNRLNTVLSTIYLLFNEGYYSSRQDQAIRKNLCLEAMRLCHMLIETPQTNKPQVNALFSLMSFHSSRLDARVDSNGEMILYEDQDETLWNQDLIRQGEYYLERASVGDSLSKYHLEAGIAWMHTQKTDTPEKWENILQLYNQLLSLEYTSIAALNRTFALSKANGKHEAIIEAEKLELHDSHLYFALLGVLYTDVDNARAKQHFEQSIALAKTNSDRQMIQRKIERLGDC